MPWSSESSDEELMIGYREGDAGAFDELYGRHKGGLYRYLLRHCRDSAATEELFQDVWMNLIGARARYEVSAKFATYLYRLAHNRLIDYYRKHAHGATVSFEDDGASGIEEPIAPLHYQPEAGYDIKQRFDRFTKLLAELPEAQREAFVLQQEAGMSVEEIAGATGVSRETAKSRLRYALAKLRKGMS